jgi:predicted glycogen debranching enzyme
MHFGREILGHAAAALRREWLVTNGAGAYAMGSLLANAPTRKYHGYLVAALQPPLGRTMLVGGLSAFADYAGRRYELSGFEWQDGTLSDGYKHLEEWGMAQSAIPVARFALADAIVEQRIWMEYGANTTYVQFSHVRGGPIGLDLRPLITERDHHATTVAEDWRPAIAAIEHGALVTTPAGVGLRLLCAGAAWNANGTDWIEQIHYGWEKYRGHDDEARLLVAGSFRATLQPGQSLTLVFSTEAAPDLNGAGALIRETLRQKALLDAADPALALPPFIRQLVLAADQFLVRREVALPDGTLWPGWSVIAGYPWFSDWGRDTMIALPGLLVATGRAALAGEVLRTWSSFVSQGMLPNRFPDANDEPEYNTVDATLWFFQAIRAVYHATHDLALVADLYPVLTDIVAWHRRGTRYSIKVAADGLLAAGEPDVQLTWMDAKYEGWVITPREGKAVEINALWYSALRTLAEFAADLHQPADADAFTAEAERVQLAFGRFWNAEQGYLYDVLDSPQGDDAALRPNQLFAVSVAHSPLGDEQARAVVAACATQLYTSYGLRSLAPDDPQYIGIYQGDLESRDSAYHQGTVWGWLIGPFVSAVARVYGPDQARAYLLPFADHLRDAGIGSISEIFNADPPFTPQGCPWQAWSVAEVLRCWRALDPAGGGR